MKNILILLIVLTITACGKKSDKKYFADTTIENFSSIINEGSARTTASSKETSVLDETYYRGKMKISIHSDETFSFEFAGNKKSTGKWRFEDNSIQLEANLGWIPLEMFIFKKSPDGSKYYLQFVDAQGTKVRDLETIESL
jgi:hypothetical protein